MGTAVVNQNGHIEYVMAKVSPMFIRQAGTRLLPYNAPPYDPEVSVLTPDVPVPEAATEVTFTITPKEGYEDLVKARLIYKIDQDVDLIYLNAIGNRGPEYTEAERQAKEYAEANYEGTAPPYVACWATAKGWTDQQAADDILTQATAWRTAAETMRAQRLLAKESVRTGDATAAMAVWNAFVSHIRTTLGISLNTQ